MTGATTSLAREVPHHAEGTAALVVALVALLLVPVPALFAAVGADVAHVGRLAVMQTLHALLADTPVFAVVPFVLGAGVGTLLHLVVTAPDRFAAIRADRYAKVGARSLIALSLIVGGAFAATGLVAAIALY